ncbi:MAG: hypothetical protein V7K64_13565 [Nostoc sp.]|uniref:hypothetical protein n=1 Tax=Nostoc sp. TaxID=1180 RepID=UPI002FFD0DD3
MADRTLGRVWFALLRETTGDAGRVKDDPYGYFSCRSNVARFLDIESKAFNGTIYGKEREYKGERVLTLADGTKLNKGILNTDGKNAGEPVAIQRVVGKRRVILRTGKPIGTVVAGKTPSYHTLSFAFPTWATIATIADALGEIIPAGKMKSSPTAADIRPQFTIEGGGTYGIMSPAAAATRTKASTSKTALKAKVESDGGEVQEGVAN